MNYNQDNPIWKFREQLLKATISWCMEKSSFYKKHFGKAGIHFRGLEDLHTLPILFRDMLDGQEEQFCCEKVQPSCIQYTSGTTGKFITLFRSPSEIAFINNFFNERVQQLVNDKNSKRPLWLSLISAYHGSPTPVPGWPYIVSAGVYDLTQVRQAARMLLRTYDFPGVEPQVTCLVGGDILIKAFTAYLIAEKVDIANLPVRLLVLTGGYLSTVRKRLLGELWGAQVQDRWSMSEVFGGASQCGMGGPFIFDIHAVPEVVHPKTLQPIDHGVGTLVMTGLYPFMQMMPMVRYYTGDLVEITASPLRGDTELLVNFVGRERRSILDTSGPEVQPLLLSGPLYDIVESFADIGSSTRFDDLTNSANLEFAGRLHYSVESELVEDGSKGSITITLGLRYPPWLHSARVLEVQTQFRSKLYERFPAIKAKVLDGSVQLKIQTEHMDEVPLYNAK